MTVINIKGPIISNGEKWIYDWFGEDSTCPNDVLQSLPNDNSPITVIINSGGGYVSCGNEIYTTLMSYLGNVTVDVIEAASAASVIAMAGDTVRITPVGQIMIHNVSCRAAGDYRAMDKTSQILQKANQSICAAYEIKTGLSREELLNMMDEETWMTAEEAKEKGFVDEILFQEESAPILVANCKDLIPQNIISRMQDMKQNNQLGDPSDRGTNPEVLQSEIHEMIKKAAADAVNELIAEKGPQKPEKEGTDKSNRFFFI